MRRQAQRHADVARRAADSRRANESGVTGFVADRAGEWTLDDRDFDFIERQKYFWNPLLDYWFRMDISGWDRLPDPPALVVGIHSGAPFPWDAWAVGIQWWRHFGEDRPLHGTAHDALMALPVVGAYSRRRPTACPRRWRRVATSSSIRAASGTPCVSGRSATKRSSPGGPDSS